MREENLLEKPLKAKDLDSVRIYLLRTQAPSLNLPSNLRPVNGLTIKVLHKAAYALHLQIIFIPETLPFPPPSVCTNASPLLCVPTPGMTTAGRYVSTEIVDRNPQLSLQRETASPATRTETASFFITTGHSFIGS